MKLVIKILEKIIVSFILIYIFNIIMVKTNINIPLNIINLSVVTILGLPSFISIILIYLSIN